MKKVFYTFLLLIAISNYVSAQDEEIGSPFSFGLSGGIDYNMNAYKMSGETEAVLNYYSVKPHFNIDANIGMKMSKKTRIRFDVKFVKLSYGQNFTSEYSTFGKTITKLYNIDFNIYFDYLLLHKSKWDIYLSPALKSEFVVQRFYKTTMEDGTIRASKWYFLKTAFPNQIAGGAISSIIKYNLTNHVGITLTPEYTMFFRDFVRGNSGLYTRFNTNLGVEFKF